MSQAYLLLDSTQIDNLAHRLFEVAPSVHFHSLFQRTAYSALDEVSPVLVPVTLNSPLAQTFSEQWSATAGIWLESLADEKTVVEHVRSLIHARVEGEVTVLFRFYDPRITALWLAELPAHERAPLMGPIQLIRLPHSVIHQPQPDQPVARYADTPWLVLRAEQLAHLNSAKQQSFAQRLIDHCETYFPDYLQGQDMTAEQWVAHCQNTAERYGYSAADEIFLWARFQAVLGTDFPQGPAHGAYRLILAEPGVTPEQRLDNLNTELTYQLLTNKEPCA
ncbi:DUF4123 domain-containing protein [Pseudomonas psychrophila]|uniref:DUF4123 domain-containing protein n=1 Tax=Pseudomonas psychrophila TaxID=122355 RepID=UPI0037F2FA79